MIGKERFSGRPDGHAASSPVPAEVDHDTLHQISCPNGARRSSPLRPGNYDLERAIIAVEFHLRQKGQAVAKDDRAKCADLTSVPAVRQNDVDLIGAGPTSSMA